MNEILKEAKSAVTSAKTMIGYYEKEVEKYSRLLEQQIEKATQLENEYNQLERVVKALPTHS